MDGNMPLLSQRRKPAANAAASRFSGNLGFYLSDIYSVYLSAASCDCAP